MPILSWLFKPAAYVGIPVYLLHRASEASPIARYYVRLGLYLSTLGLCSVWGVCVSIGLSLAGRQLDVNWVIGRSFHAIAGNALDIRFEVEGEEHITDAGAAVLVGNHQSMLDILYLGRIFPKRASIMAKKELQWTPLLGQYMSFSGAVFVDRGNNAKAVRSLKAAAERLSKERMALWMFPEGTRSMREHSDMLPFKKGAFHLAIQAGVPIIPVVCENYWRLYRKGVFESGVLKIRVLPPVLTADLTTEDVSELANRVRESMLVALREISDPAPSAPKSTQPSYAQSTIRARDRTPRPKTPPVEVEEPQTVVDEPVPPKPFADKDVSHESLASDFSLGGRMRTESASGAETEEDEGMVLVSRPSS